MASRSSDGRRYYFGLIRGTKHRFYDPESPIIAPESEPISETGSPRDSLLQQGVMYKPALTSCHHLEDGLRPVR